METRGLLAPTSATETREYYEAVGPAAQTVVREVARGIGLDREAYASAVTADLVETARDALFASLLAVKVGSMAEWEDQRAALADDVAVSTVGSEHVERVVWHEAPFAGQAVAATFQDEPDAAVATLRRQAFGRIYRDVLHEA